jgi:hypothetical protein
MPKVMGKVYLDSREIDEVMAQVIKNVCEYYGLEQVPIEGKRRGRQKGRRDKRVLVKVIGG